MYIGAYPITQMRSHSIGLPPGYCADSPLAQADVDAYASGITALGGAVNSADMDALFTHFVNPIYCAGLRSKMIECYPLYWTSVASASRKLWRHPSAPTELTFFNYTNANITQAAGAIGNGSNRYADTGLFVGDLGLVSPSQASPVPVNIGLGIFITVAGTTDSYEIGRAHFQDAANRRFAIARNTTQTRAHILSQEETGVLTHTNTTVGWHYGTRTSTTDARLYKNSTAVVTVNTNGGVILANGKIFLQALNYDASGAIAYSNHSHGMFLITQGLTNSEAVFVAERVQALMVAWGRA